jgi:signal transduction histidine kinase/sensor domain CHASE-containing protein
MSMPAIRFEDKKITKLERVSIRISPLLVFVVTLSLALLASYGFQRYSSFSERTRFEQRANSARMRIVDRMRTYTDLLLLARGLFEANAGVVSQEQFRRFVQSIDLHERYPGIQGIGYARRLRFADRDSFPVQFLEPRDWRNARAMGFDMYAEASRREAMQRAWKQEVPAASGPVTLVQETGDNPQTGFLIYVPVFNVSSKGVGDLIGFVYSPFRAEDLFDGIFGDQLSSRLDIEVKVFDEAENAKAAPRPLYDSQAPRFPGGSFKRPRFEENNSLAIAGRKWRVSIASLPSFDIGSFRHIGVSIALAGTLASLLLLRLLVLTRRGVEADRRARAASNERAAILESVNTVGRSLTAELDLDHLMTLLTVEASKLIRAQLGLCFIKEEAKVGASEETGGEAAGNARSHFKTAAVFGSQPERIKTLSSEMRDSVCQRTFGAKKILRIEDLSQFPETGGRQNYRSLLAVPMLSRSEELLGGLLFLDERAAAFSEQDEGLMEGIAAQAAVAIDNARLFRKAQEASLAKSAFLANMSHEIRTPLTAVMGYADLLHDQDITNEERLQYSAAIERSGQQLTRLIDNILDLSKLESAGYIKTQMQEIDLEELLAELVSLTRAECERKGLDFVLDSGPSFPRRVVSDGVRLRQLLSNLLENAVKFTSKGSVRVTLGFDSRSTSEGEFWMRIRDTGLGIRANERAYLFQAFSQADMSASRRFGGSGLGLVLSRRLAEALGGSVKLRWSEPGRGSEFECRVHMFLPVRVEWTGPRPLRAEPSERAL